MQRSKIKVIISITLMLLLAIIVGLWSYMAIWLGDDIHYGFFCDYPATHSLPINSPWEIFSSMNNHYIHSNGRSVAHWLVQWFIAFGGKTLFSIVNAAVYVVCAVYILKLGKMRWQLHPRALFFVIVILLIAFRTKFTPSCQIGYVWMMTSTSIAVDLLLNVKEVKRVWFLPLVVFCFFAGWGNEAISVGSFVAIFGYVFLKKDRVTETQRIIAVSYCFGVLVLFAAPGNFLKLHSGSPAGNFPPLQIKISVNYMAHLSRMLYLLVIVIVYMLATHRTSLREIYKNNAFFANALITLILFNFVITVYCNRQLFGIEFFALIIAVRLISQYGLGSKVRVLGAICLLMYVVAVCNHNYKYLTRQQNTYRDIVKQHQMSSDGTVYCHTKTKHSLFYAEGPNQDVESSHESLEWLWRSQGITKPLRILPDCLKGKTQLRLKTQVVNLGDGSYLLISSNYKPAKQFIVHIQHRLGSFTKACGESYSIPDHDTSNKQKAYVYKIRCPHFIATIVNGDNLTKYVSGVDIEYARSE